MVPFNVRDKPSRNVIGVCPYFLLFPVSPDVQEDRLAAAVGRDEAEAFVVLPGGDFSLVAHGVGGMRGRGE